MRQSIRVRYGRLRERRQLQLPLVEKRKTQNVKPRIAITEGDPAGIGPEIARRAAADARVLGVCEPVLYGAAAGERFQPGVLSAEAGRAAHDAIVRAAADAQS